MRKIFGPVKRNWHVEDQHQSRVDGTIQRSGYYFRNLKRKTMMVKKRGNNARRQNCEGSV